VSEQEFLQNLEKKLWTAAELEIRDDYTPKSIVTLIVEMLQPFQGRV
jgi:type I restriction-modification system DNA methylase subunit